MKSTDDLIKEAKRRYPEGTEFYSAWSGDRYTSNGIFEKHNRYNSINCTSFGCVYNENKWAEIVNEFIYEIY